MNLKDILVAVVASVVVSIFVVGMFFSPEDGRDGRDGLGGTIGSEVTHDVDFRGEVGLRERYTTISTDYTVQVAESGTTFLVASGTTATLPAVSTAGQVYRFIISGAIADTNFVVDSAEGDNIEGSLIVAGAVVDCAAEDQINFVADGENLGDSVELRSDGTSWLLTDSNGLTAAKITCTDPS